MSAAQQVTKRLTDTSGYTGSHKERFDTGGKGKGKAGRENLVVVDGSTSSSSRNHEVTGSNSSLKSSSYKPVVKAKTDAETFGETARKIMLFQYADKNHAGEKLVLTKQKFPTFKQLSDATIPFTPAGKPKLLLDKNRKEVKTLEEVVDGGSYLVITAFDKGKMEDAKLPAKYKSAEK